MTTHLPSQDEPAVKATSAVEGPQAAMPPHASAPQPVVLPKQQEPEEEESFYFEEEQPDLVDTPFVAPFQVSSAMPMMAAQEQPSGQVSAGPAPVKKAGRKPRLSLTMIAILVCAVVLVGMLVMNALAQTTPPLQTHGSGTSPTTQQPAPPQQKPPGNQQTLTMKPTPAPTNGTHGQGPATRGHLDLHHRHPADAVAGQLLQRDIQRIVGLRGQDIAVHGLRKKSVESRMASKKIRAPTPASRPIAVLISSHLSK